MKNMTWEAVSRSRRELESLVIGPYFGAMGGITLLLGRLSGGQI